MSAPSSASMAQNSHLVEDQSAVEAFLSSPSAYPGWDGPVDRIDTYGAMLFLAGRRVIKIKRAVRYPYMDFSTLEKRHAVCRNEITLNRRTAPDLYVGVCCICRFGDGSFVLQTGETPPDDAMVVEWGVDMRRFDEDLQLDHLAERQALTDTHLKVLADRIGEFHEKAERLPNGPAFLPAVKLIVDQNTEAFDEFPSLFAQDRVAALHRNSHEWIARLASTIEERQRDGFVRHCHGDLHLANIVCLDGIPTLFDALEFDDDMARTDVFYDLAFLIMDLWERDYFASANLVLNRYVARTGDRSGLTTLPLFLSMRAAIRSKIAAAQNDPDQAEKYFSFAEQFLAPRPAQLVAVGGLSGTGKSTLGRAVAPHIGRAPGALHLRSDVLRKSLLGVAETERLGDNAYTADLNARVYDAIRMQATTALLAGHSVIADAVFARPEERRALDHVADETGAPFTGIWLEAPAPVLKDRVRHRHGDASNATETVVEKQLGYDIGPMAWSVLASDTDIETLQQRALDLANRSVDTVKMGTKEPAS